MEVGELNLGFGCLYNYSFFPFSISNLLTYIDSICDGLNKLFVLPMPEKNNP